MDYSLTEEQRLLQKTARDVLADAGRPSDFEQAAAATGYDAQLWAKFAELGWLDVLSDESNDGTARAVEAALLVSELGRAFVPSPFVSTAVLATRLLKTFGGQDAGDELAAIASGERVWSIAAWGSGGSCGLPTDDAVILESAVSGTRFFVEYGPFAQRFVVAASATGTVGVAAVGANDGIDIDPLSTIDGWPMALVSFSKAPVLSDVLLTTGEMGADAWSELSSWGALMAAAELAGIAERVLEMTLAYLKDRTQFGQPIGSFQGPQHQAADMSIDVQATRLTMLQAAWYLGQGERCHPSISVAKACASDAVRRVVHRGHQLHGAIGFTLEHDMQRFFRRAKSLEVAFGDARQHQLRVASSRIAEQRGVPAWI